MVEELPDQPRQTEQNDPDKKKRICLVIWLATLGAVVLGLIIFVIIVVLNRPNAEEPETSEKDSVVTSQTITNADGTEFNSAYNVAKDEDFSFRLANLTCNEDCSNVSTVKIGDQTLKAGEDYKVERGSIIITIFKKVLQTLTNGEYNIKVEIKEGEETTTINVSISIRKDETPTEPTSPTTPTAPSTPTEPTTPATPAEPTTPAAPTEPTTPTTPPTTPAEPESPTEPETPKTCSELKNCDYNLNDQYVFATGTYNFWALPKGVTSICDTDESGNYYVDVYPIVETKTFYYIGHFNGTELRPAGVPLDAQDLVMDTAFTQAQSYAAKKGYVAQIPEWSHCPGGGAGSYAKIWNWQEVVDDGLALDEQKCATWGLSCGRW